jgi:hypothetical protein
MPAAATVMNRRTKRGAPVFIGILPAVGPRRPVLT